MRLLACHLLLLALVFPLLAVSTAAAGVAPPFALLAEARVSGATIHLSDLLPAEAPASLRRSGEAIRISAAPPPGGHLSLPADTINAALPLSARQAVLVPSEVLVLRGARALTREEVLAALRASRFPADAGLDASGLQPEDLNFSAPVRVAAEDARLQVRRAEFDSALGLARFVLASAADPNALPFLVTARLPPPAPLLTAAPGSIRPPSPVRAPALVAPGQPARLHVSSSNLQMLLEVVPLERGALHQVVRVRLPSSGRVLRGVVVAPGRLEAQF